MAVKITSITFNNEFRPESTSWLLANIGEKITATIELTAETVIISSTDLPFIYRNNDGFIGNTATEGWITDEAERFIDIKIGDNIILHNYSAVTDTLHVVLDKLNDGALFISNAGGANNQILTTFAVSIAEPTTALSLKFGLIENNGQTNYLSLTDGNTQEFIIKEIDANDFTAYPMEAKGSKSWQIGGATAAGNGINSSNIYNNKFIIEHTFYITPFFLAEQWADLQLNQAPDYFNDVNTLKYVYEISAFYEYSDPNKIYFTEQSEVLGNCGWFNENFNNNPSNYEVTSVIFKDAGLNVIDSLELTSAVNNFEVTIKNLIDAPFSNNNTKFTLNYVKAPGDAAQYTNNGQTLDQNFLFDRLLQTVGSAAINGENYGTARQVFTDVSAQFISASEIKIIGKVELSPEILAEYTALDEKRFILWITTQNHTIPTKDADKVSLLINAQDYFINTADPGLIDFENIFLRHPESDPITEGVAALNSAFEEDEALAVTKFYIDKNGRLNDSINLTSLTVKIKAKNNISGQSFDLDALNFDLNGLEIINGLQYIDLSLDRVFKLPSTDLRKKVKIKRRSDLDAGNLFYYELYFPFLIRWEYWKKLTGVNSDFFDINEPNNGFNNFWFRYNNAANWFIYYDLTINVNKNGDALAYNYNSQLTVYDYNSNINWSLENIKSYDNETNDLLNDGPNSYLLGYKDTRIEAEFTNNVNPPTSLIDFYVNLGIEVFEEGGIEGRRRISSVYDVGPESWFKSVDGSNKVKLSLSGNTIKAEALIDYNKIPNDKTRFKITARLYDFRILTGKLFQDNDEFLFMDGDGYLFMDE